MCRPKDVDASTLMLLFALPLSGPAPDVGGAVTPPVGAPPAAPPAVVTAPPRRPAPPRAWFPRSEIARYDIRYGMLGSIGRLELRTAGATPAADGRSIVKLRGSGHGSVFGLGSMDRRFEADFDTGAFFGFPGAGTPAPSGVRCSVALEGPEPAGRYQELAAAVDEHCPVLDLFSRPVPVERAVTTA